MWSGIPSALGLLIAACGPDASGPAARCALKGGDRVVFLGSGLVEQDRLHGHLETALTSRNPDARLLFRNLGWGGDTVRGDARTAGYQNPAGLARLLKEVRDLRPTVLFLGYGMNESFDGARGLARFVEDYDRLLTKLVPLKARLVLLSPTYHEDLGRPFPDPARHNADLEKYTAALKGLAARRRLTFVDLFHPLRAAKQACPSLRLTTNGIHLTDAGYAVAARAVGRQLGLPELRWRVEVDATGKVLARAGTRVDRVAAAGGGVRFRASDAALPPPAEGPAAGEARVLRVTGLKPGEYVLKIDGQDVLRARAADWEGGVRITAGPEFRDLEKLRQAVVRKHELFYRRWRPFNDFAEHWGYIRGDFALYDKDIARQEQAIARARTPRPHTYEISATKGTK
jgi:lysophospholipase L1-like esterase